MIKTPLILAAAILVLRIILEQAGAPHWLNQVFGVNWLYLIFVIYFALRIVSLGEARPYIALLKTFGAYVFATRFLISITYVLAYAFTWTAPRFTVERGGVIGEGITPIEGYLLIPFQIMVFTTIAITLIGMIFGSIAVAIARKRQPAESAA